MITIEAPQQLRSKTSGIWKFKKLTFKRIIMLTKYHEMLSLTEGYLNNGLKPITGLNRFVT